MTKASDAKESQQGISLQDAFVACHSACAVDTIAVECLFHVEFLPLDKENNSVKHLLSRSGQRGKVKTIPFSGKDGLKSGKADIGHGDS